VTFPELGSNLWATIIGLSAVMGFGALAQPQMILRYATICNKIDQKKALLIAVLGSFIFPLAAYSYGPLSRAILLSYGYDVMTMNANFIIPTFIKTAFPAWLVALFLAGVLCAATSTIDSLVHMSSGTITRDIIRPLRSKMSDRSQLSLTKTLSLIVTVVCCLFAIFQPGLIVTLSAYTWQVLASSFFGPIVGALFIKRSNKLGAISGMIAGFAVSQLWYLFLAPPVTPIYAFFPGVASSIIVTFAASHLAKPLDGEFIAKLYP